MKKQRVTSVIWKVMAVVIIASLTLFSTISTSGLAAPKDKGKGTHDVALAPVAPPQIHTHPLHRGKAKNNTTPGGPDAVAGVETGAVAAPDAAAEAGADDAGADIAVETQPLAPAATAAAVHAADPRDMKVLVISPIAEQYFTNDPNGYGPNLIYDTTYRLKAIKSFLDQIGIPYDVYVANSAGQHTPLTESMLWDGANHGSYQGIILETGNQWIYSGGGNFVQFLDSTEWTTLWNYEAMFGVRELVMFVGPSASNAESFGLTYTGEQAIADTAVPAALTDAGKLVYPYLNAANPVPFKNTYFYSTTINAADPALNPNPAEPLLLLNGAPVASTHTAADGHETLTFTADYTNYLTASLALSYGSINWLTRGLFLGERHTYLAPQVDDLLVADNIWDPASKTDVNNTYRITGSDLTAVKAWQNASFPTSTCVTLQPNASQGKDAYLKSDNVLDNTGNETVLITRSANRLYSDRHALIQFDLSSIPQGYTISSAVLSLYLNKSSGSQTDKVEVHRVTRSWTEGRGTFLSGASWRTYNGINTWKTAGGDYDATVSGSFVAGAVGWKQADITQLVQGWASASATNYGMILFSASSSGFTNNEKQYLSSDNSTATRRPKLDVCYAAPAVKLEFAFNGEGASGIYNPDTLTPQVIKDQINFRWVNHTYYHNDLDSLTYDEAMQELTLNENVAVNQLKLTNYSRAPMIQPNISGLYNPNFQKAAYDFGVRYLISNTSLAEWNNPSPNTGFYSPLQPGLFIIPRHPTNMFYNLTSPDQWVSEYNCYYGPNATCANGQFKFWDHDLTYSEILDKESDMMLQYLLRWDVDPLMFHQANLAAYDGKNTLLGQLVDATLAKYRALVSLPISNLSQVEIGQKMIDRMAYNASGVKATYTPCTGIALSVANAAKVPLTGVAYDGIKESYGGQTISYVTVNAGQTINIPVSCP